MDKAHTTRLLSTEKVVGDLHSLCMQYCIIAELKTKAPVKHAEQIGIYHVNLFRRPFVNVKMKYQSSRGGSRGSTFESVLFAGYAPDGGLFVPSTIPSISRQELKVRAIEAKVEINSDHIIHMSVVGLKVGGMG